MLQALQSLNDVIQNPGNHLIVITNWPNLLFTAEKRRYIFGTVKQIPKW